ncbi:MAG: hypothetical protein QXQ40_01125 [Candidatus Aenigmatarchaeota archaeon]
MDYANVERAKKHALRIAIKMKSMSMNLLTMIIIFVGVLALSIVLFNPGGIVRTFNELLSGLSGEGWRSINLTQGHEAVHIYLQNVQERGRPDYGMVYIYEFHLLDSIEHMVVNPLAKGEAKAYFAPKNWKGDKCAVFVSDHSGLAPTIHRGGNRIFYVNQGTIIQDGMRNLKDVLASYEGKCDCIRQDGTKGEYTVISSVGCFGTTICNDVTPTLDAGFGSGAFDKCEEFKKYHEMCPRDGCCHLLQKNELGDYVYKVKYGIICGYSDSEAMWWACTEDNDGAEILAGEEKYKCNFENGIGKWKIKEEGCKVFATRLGLVGKITAYNYKIKEKDRLAALPYRFSAPEGERYLDNPVKIKVTYPKTGKSVIVPVLDVGPWNEKDNYWEAERDTWGVDEYSLKNNFPELCEPMAQAAYYEGWHYNYTVSRSGYNKEKQKYERIPYDPKTGNPGTQRLVLNPAGIDLGDGTWDDLEMTNNDWVEWKFVRTEK